MTASETDGRTGGRSNGGTGRWTADDEDEFAGRRAPIDDGVR